MLKTEMMDFEIRRTLSPDIWNTVSYDSDLCIVISEQDELSDTLLSDVPVKEYTATDKDGRKRIFEVTFTDQPGMEEAAVSNLLDDVFEKFNKTVLHDTPGDKRAIVDSDAGGYY